MTARELYDGTTNADGYGVLPKARWGTRLAHRAALADKLGRPVVGDTRHACHNPPCIAWGHFSEGSHADNMADMAEADRGRGGRADQTHCVRQHELTPDNIRWKPNPECRSGYERRCRTCSTEDSRKQAARRKTARARQKESA